MSASARAAAPAEKTQKNAAKQKPRQAGGLRLVTWQPGSETEGSRPLEPDTRAAMESRFGHDFGRVRIHTGAEADRSSELLGAHAYTLGLDVHFRKGRYRPDEPAGQALLVHELEHVVRAGPRGPEVPKLQPDTTNDRNNLMGILSMKSGRAKRFEDFVKAHPGSVETAEEVLVFWQSGDKNETEKARLLSFLASRDPKSVDRVARLVRVKTAGLREDARLATWVMWENYQSAAYEHAFVKWAETRIQEERLKRPKTRGVVSAVPTDREREYEDWRRFAQGQLDRLTADSGRLVKAYNTAVTLMMEAARPRIDAQSDVIDELSALVLGGIVKTKRARMETYADTSLLEKLDAARTPKPGDVGMRLAAEDRLKAEAVPLTRRMMRLSPHTPRYNTSDKLFTEKDFWWVQHRALLNIEEGFPGFTAEHTTQPIISQKSAVAENRKGLGLTNNAPFSTYDRHGQGQYDVHDNAGEVIVAALPDTVDLALMFQRSSPMIFRRVASRVKDASPVDQAAANDDVLAKLVHGYFGFLQTDRKRMQAHLENQPGGLSPMPDASRLFGALTYENVLATPPSPDVVADLKAIRTALEAAVHAELRKLKEPIDIKNDKVILGTIDASARSFNQYHVVPKEIVDEILLARPKMSRKAANDLVFEVVQRIVATEPAIASPLKALMKKLFEKGIGNRSGPAVTLIHRYQEPMTGEEAWVEVDYRHLYNVIAAKWAKVEPGDPIAQVGSSGNAISPHIHMAIRVYKRSPDGKGLVEAGNLPPDEFFPLRRRRP